ncbi:VOC family protein [Brevibacillus choshinensis]|uniref:VOC family protein n=1 Tax=Brevibacillus choshinensis TaxID=54911 RepID=UPI002E1F3F39|nr:VOC family protein [Brevibacillus choshinensis]MED4755581.1 VOC family protein [Brevibacillus choshinensis]MED4784930.1 VOC family protein [Brevibacillus choshinensis]
MALTNGVHHVGLSVTNLEASKEFFTEVLEFQLLQHEAGHHAYVTDGVTMITLWQTAELEASVKVAGMHHLALSVKSLEVLRQIEERMKQRKINLQFGGIGVKGQEGGFIALFCYEPSGIRIELTTTERDLEKEIPIIGGCGAVTE